MHHVLRHNSFLSIRCARASRLRSASDLPALLDALGIPKAVVGGYDWGGRAAHRIGALAGTGGGLVSGNSYNIQHIARSLEPASASGKRPRRRKYTSF